MAKPKTTGRPTAEAHALSPGIHKRHAAHHNKIHRHLGTMRTHLKSSKKPEGLIKELDKVMKELHKEKAAHPEHPLTNEHAVEILKSLHKHARLEDMHQLIRESSLSPENKRKYMNELTTVYKEYEDGVIGKVSAGEIEHVLENLHFHLPSVLSRTGRKGQVSSESRGRRGSAKTSSGREKGKKGPTGVVNWLKERLAA